MQLLWTVMPAPGPIRALTVGATSAGLALVAFGDHPEAAARAADRLGFPAVKKEPADAVAQLREYLAGERRVFDLPCAMRRSVISPAQRGEIGGTSLDLMANPAPKGNIGNSSMPGN
jgi:hypothetical protein